MDPRLAHDSDRTVAEAKALWWLVDRPNLFIKIPATEAGLPAITATLAEGISVNVTLIFGLDRYSAVMEAFLAGLEQAKANGHDLSKIGSVASFFVSRVDSEVDKRLEKIGSEQAKALRGKAAVANAQLAYERYTEVSPPTAGRRSPTPARTRSGRCGRPPRRRTRTTATSSTSRSSSRPARSTPCRSRSSTRTPITARPAATPSPAPTTRPGRSSPTWSSVGVDIDDVIATLEREGVEKFEASWQELLDGVRKSLEAAAEGQGLAEQGRQGNAEAAQQAGGNA